MVLRRFPWSHWQRSPHVDSCAPFPHADVLGKLALLDGTAVTDTERDDADSYFRLLEEEGAAEAERAQQTLELQQRYADRSSLVPKQHNMQSNDSTGLVIPTLCDPIL